MGAWTMDGVEIGRNPVSFTPRFIKSIVYTDLVTGRTRRSVPEVSPVSMYYDAEWNYVGEDIRNLLHDLYVMDEYFELKTHLTHNPREAWRVKIDSFDSEYLVTRNEMQLFNISCTFKVIDSLNDPILVKEFDTPSHPFLVHNPTNIDIHNAVIFISSNDKDINGIQIDWSGSNLLKNPGFEHVGGLKEVYHWDNLNGSWLSDVVLFHEGEKCVRTNINHSPISQTFNCPPNEQISLTFFCMADINGDNRVKVSLIFYDSDDNILSQREEGFSVGVAGQWGEYYMYIESTPAETVKATVSIEKIDGDEGLHDYVYIDRVFVGVGEGIFASRNSDDPPPKMLSFPDVIPKGKTLKLDLINETAHIDGENVSDKVRGEYLKIPTGNSLFTFSEADYRSGKIKTIIRYNEVYR